MLLVSTVQAVKVVTILLHDQQSNNFREEQHQNAQWGGLPIEMCCVTAFPFGGPSKWCTARIRGKGAVSTALIVAFDLPYSQQHARSQRWLLKSLSLP
jgi:hypothetical protein